MQKFLQDITREAGDATLKIFGQAEVQYTKSSPTDFVTQADLQADKILFDHIREMYPDHGIISEEREAFQKDAEYVWVYDPIDGTRNFATHIPLYGTMVGLARNGVMELAAMYFPATKEFFFAELGDGALLNGKSIHCSEQKEFHHSFGAFPVRHKADRVPLFEKFLKKAREGNQFGVQNVSCIAVSAAYVASGRWAWLVFSGGGIWDHCAPALILQEAGCRVTNFRGEVWKFGDTEIVAANPILHPQILDVINGA
ncbi:MAG TPA: inositol monophosphatase [Patescibacteria group bacterium]|nr:inositol monophosphatase [Patescibacteria group bacterium]